MPVSSSVLRDALDVGVEQDRRPEGLLGAAPDVAQHVQPPRVAPSDRSAASRTESPSRRTSPPSRPPRRHLPDAVPREVEVAPLVGDEGVGPRAVRVGLEQVGVPVIAERVEHDVDRVVAPERLVALHLLVDDAVRLGVVGAEADVERGRRCRRRGLRSAARRACRCPARAGRSRCPPSASLQTFSSRAPSRTIASVVKWAASVFLSAADAGARCRRGRGSARNGQSGCAQQDSHTPPATAHQGGRSRSV